MPSVTDRYNVPLPLTALWEAIAERYGDAAVVELQTLYAAASKRYNRVSELNRRHQMLAHGYPYSAERRRQYEESLTDPQAFIDRE